MNQKIRSYKVTGSPQRVHKTANQAVTLQDQYTELVNDLARLEQELRAEGKLPGFQGTNLTPVREFGDGLKDKPSNLPSRHEPESVFGEPVPTKPQWTGNEFSDMDDSLGTVKATHSRDDSDDPVTLMSRG